MAKSGKLAGLPYSLSRWTDVPGSKWVWFRKVLAEGEMFAFDSRTALPSLWSLKPEDTLGFNFWTKDPTNLLKDQNLLKPYKVQIHVTLTGWEEAERGAPGLSKGIELLRATMDAFGPENVIWRFSPVPLVDDVVERYTKIATQAKPPKVFVAFLQENDLMPETRGVEERREILSRLASASETQVLLCNDDKVLFDGQFSCPNLSLGVCAGPADWDNLPPEDNCGCAVMVDPFGINESCSFGCLFCYAADKTLAPKKHNSTHKSLPMVRR